MSRIALIQTRTQAAHAAALAELTPMLRAAASGGARLIATPEGCNILQRDRAQLLPALCAVENDPVVAGMRALAVELGVEVLLGSVLVQGENGPANRSLFIRADGSIAAMYDKIHMFDVDLPARAGKPAESARESHVYTPGDTAVVVEAEVGRLGLSICYDIRFPHLYRALAKAGAEILTVPAAFTRPTGEAHWEVLLRARAIENGAYVIAPAQGGLHEDGRGTWGRSMVVSPWGEVIATLDHDQPGVLFADLDLEAVAKARAAIPALVNDRLFSPPLAALSQAAE
jgi:predicted amidohydrolase